MEFNIFRVLTLLCRLHLMLSMPPTGFDVILSHAHECFHPSILLHKWQVVLSYPQIRMECGNRIVIHSIVASLPKATFEPRSTTR